MTAKTIESNIRKVFRERDSQLLSKEAYGFITCHMGFIAHFDRAGFANRYRDLRDLARALQTSEYTYGQPDYDHNLDWADEMERRQDKYSYCAPIIRALVAVARQYEDEIGVEFAARERAADMLEIERLAAKHSLTLNVA